MKIQFECLHCGDPYYIQNSTAVEKTMFCSDSCELKENVNLSSEAQKLETEVRANPGDFIKTKPIASLEQVFSPTEVQSMNAISSVVDGFFDKLTGANKPKGKNQK